MQEALPNNGTSFTLPVSAREYFFYKDMLVPPQTATYEHVHGIEYRHYEPFYEEKRMPGFRVMDDKPGVIKVTVVDDELPEPCNPTTVKTVLSFLGKLVGELDPNKLELIQFLGDALSNYLQQPDATSFLKKYTLRYCSGFLITGLLAIFIHPVLPVVVAVSLIVVGLLIGFGAGFKHSSYAFTQATEHAEEQLCETISQARKTLSASESHNQNFEQNVASKLTFGNTDSAQNVNTATHDIANAGSSRSNFFNLRFNRSYENNETMPLNDDKQYSNTYTGIYTGHHK